MATYTIHEAISRLEGLLDRVAEDAQTYMKEYITQNANQGYQTGALAESIDIEPRGEDARSVGTSLKSKTSGQVYGAFVDKGRGPITKDPGFLQYYDPKFGRWVRTHHVNGMRGIGFIAATKRHLETTRFGL